MGKAHLRETGKANLQKQGKSISPIYITEEYNKRLQQKSKTTASGLDIDVSSAKKSLAVQKQKQGDISEKPKSDAKEYFSEQFKEFWIFYQKPVKTIDWSKKPILMEKCFKRFNARMKECDGDFEGFMANVKAYFEFKDIETSGTLAMGVDVYLNGKCEVDYIGKVQELKMKQSKANEGKPQPKNVIVKTPEEVESERLLERIAIEKKQVAYESLTESQKKHTDDFSTHLKGRFSVVHHDWIENSIFSDVGNETTILEIKVFNAKHIPTIERKIEEIPRLYFHCFGCNIGNVILTKI